MKNSIPISSQTVAVELKRTRRTGNSSHRTKESIFNYEEIGETTTTNHPRRYHQHLQDI